MLSGILTEEILAWSRDRADAPAISSLAGGVRSLSYGELGARAMAIAGALRRATAPGDCCVIAAARTVDAAAALLGALIAGVAVICFDPRQGLARLQAILDGAPCGVVIADVAGARLYVRAEAARIDAAGGGDLWTLPGAAAHAAGSARRVRPLAEVVELDGGSGDAGCARDPDAPAVVLFTSGSTGAPRGVQIGLGDLSRRVEAEVDWFGLTCADVTLGILPLSFDVGLMQMLGALRAGGRHVLLGSWLPADVARAAREWGATGLAASPMLWSASLRAEAPEPVWDALRGLRYATVSGGDIGAPGVLQLVRALAPCGLYKTYGMTEMFRIASASPAMTADAPGAVGPPYRGVEVAVLGEGGARLGPGASGEIVAWGMGRMLGYLDSEAASPLRPAPPALELPEGTMVVFTGDRGWIDPAGRLHVEGRADEMLKILDQRVYPAEVANHVGRILGLAEVAVVPLTGAGGEAAFHAFHAGEAAQEAEAEAEAEALRALRSALPAHLVPKRIVRLAALPHTGSGKLDRLQLIKLAKKLTAES